MEVLAAAGCAVEDADPRTFTGAATMQRFVAGAPDAVGRIYRVAFSPGAATHWHIHSDVQMLFIVEGCCVAQVWGQAPQFARAGDVVRFEAGEKHWHGATADGPMTHLAMNFGGSTEWLEPAPGAPPDYSSGPESTGSPACSQSSLPPA